MPSVRWFIEDQCARLVARDFAGAASAFSIPLVIVSGRDSRVVFREDELHGILEGLLEELALGDQRVLQRQLVEESQGRSLTMLSFVDRVQGPDGAVLLELRSSFTMRQSLGHGAIMIWTVLDVPDALARRLFDARPPEQRRRS
ncbi:MAG: hypothetical protein AAF677_10015 [Pseudomonadota bacterium]